MVTDLHADDAGFVRAPESRCYRTMTDVGGWPSFWPSTVVTELGEDRVGVVAGRWPHRLRLDLTLGAWRHDAGFVATVRGDLEGRWEVWLEPGWGGTVVHHVLAARGAADRLPVFRRWVRAGLWGLKDELEPSERDAMIAPLPADQTSSAPTGQDTA